MTAYELALEAAKALSDKKGENIKVIKITKVSTLADYMVIATGGSNTHVKALAEELEYKLKEEGYNASHVEGHRSNTWILLDYITVIAHVFSEDAREFYNLERLWQDGEEIDISEIIKD